MKKLLFTQLFVLMALVGFSQATKTTINLGFNETGKTFIDTPDSDSLVSAATGSSLVITDTKNGQYSVVAYWLNNGTMKDSINFGATGKAYLSVLASATAPVILRIDLANEQAPGSLTSKDRAANTAPATTPALTTTPTWYNIGPVSVWKQSYITGNNGSVDSTAINELDFFGLPTDGTTEYTGTITVDSLVISDSPIVTAVTNPNLVSGSTKLFPNPVSGTATLSYSLKEGSNVKLVLNDMTGRPIRTISEGYRNAGDINESINVSDLQQGMYNVSFIIDGASVKIEKMAVK